MMSNLISPALSAEDVIQLLNLKPLPGEGGFFTRTYESARKISISDGEQRWNDRFIGTAIYFLITPGDFSALHRLPDEEVFHFYMGDPVEMNGTRF